MVDQIELNDQLNYRLEDIYPDIEKSDDLSHETVLRAPSIKGKSRANSGSVIHQL